MDEPQVWSCAALATVVAIMERCCLCWANRRGRADDEKEVDTAGMSDGEMLKAILTKMQKLSALDKLEDIREMCDMMAAGDGAVVNNLPERSMTPDAGALSSQSAPDALSSHHGHQKALPDVPKSLDLIFHKLADMQREMGRPANDGASWNRVQRPNAHTVRP